MSAFEDAIGTVASNIANAGLSLDPNMQQRLVELEGRCVQLTSTAPSATFYIAVRDGRLSIAGEHDDVPHTIVTGTGANIAAWLANPQRTQELTIDGDLVVLEEMSVAMKSFEPEFAEPLSRVLGNETAQNVLGTAELAVSALRSAAEGMGNALQQTAASRFVTREDTNALLDTLDELRLRIDRLAARIDEREANEKDGG